jgi:L1 cell adhesion molecule like protein
MSQMTPVGIDLGSAQALIGVWQNDRAEVIANEQGNRSTPCIVSFDDTESIVGDGKCIFLRFC